MYEKALQKYIADHKQNDPLVPIESKLQHAQTESDLKSIGQDLGVYFEGVLKVIASLHEKKFEKEPDTLHDLSRTF